MTLNFRSACFYALSIGTIDMCLHSCICAVWGINPELHSCWVSALPTETQPQLKMVSLWNSKSKTGKNGCVVHKLRQFSLLRLNSWSIFPARITIAKIGMETRLILDPGC